MPIFGLFCFAFPHKLMCLPTIVDRVVAVHGQRKQHPELLECPAMAAWNNCNGSCAVFQESLLVNASDELVII